MRINLGNPRTFWALVASGALVVVLAFVFWAWPEHTGAARAEETWTVEVKLINTLHAQATAGKIPSKRTLKDRIDYRTWLDEQADDAREFFERRTAYFYQSLTGEDNPSPAAFKIQYRRTVRTQREWLTRNRRSMEVGDVNATFPAPDWVSSDKLPDPSEYPRVRRDYWVRYFIYQTFLSGGVRNLKKLTIGQEPVRLDTGADDADVDEAFEGLPIEADLVLPPAKVTVLLERLLRASSQVRPMGGAPTVSPLVRFSDIRLTTYEPEGGRTARSKPLCRLYLRGHILLLTTKTEAKE